MTKDEQVLLINVLDSLDRMFDCECTVRDVHALLFATSKAITESSFCPHLESVIPELLSIIRKPGGTPETRRDAALYATDDLRQILARELPFSIAKPRMR